MNRPIRVLLQTTIPSSDDDWHIGRFSLLRDFLAGETDKSGSPMFEVTARDRDEVGRPDQVLSALDTSKFDELWLFAVDTGNGLTGADCQAISRFRRRGGGLFVTRDHMDLGCSVCTLEGVGLAHYFHSKNREPDPSRQSADDTGSPSILWPNYHSGANGDFQHIDASEPLHPVMADPDAPGGAIQFFPAHPHEGAVGQPEHEASARVVAKGHSKLSGRAFNLVVAFEASSHGGPAIAQSTFHHFADYNWDPSLGAPSFVTDVPGDGMAHSLEARRSIRQYVRNVALWLARRPINN
ncbi:MAG TPA: hypothetical protein VME63_17390 [Dyella sp.]|uniref:hypothetical protein n=1 Tax=Dyella sp. TaxID=1869338 RepID=UPI002CAEA3C3|nr:hypothetical protein [Dyella sp.]HTV87176.1 hypothetical protein [Dyella sp.]